MGERRNSFDHTERELNLDGEKKMRDSPTTKNIKIFKAVQELRNESDCNWMFLKLAEWRDPINQTFSRGQGPLG